MAEPNETETRNLVVVRNATAASPAAWAKFSDSGVLEMELPANATADQIVFFADLNSLNRRVQAHKPWARQEILLLLSHAFNAGVVAGDLDKGRDILRKAVEAYHKDIVAKNRMRYVSGAGIGVAVLILLAILIVAMAEIPLFKKLLAGSSIIVGLFAFAGVGSMTSVFMRLSTMDLKDENSKALMVLSGATKPLIAVAFACIVYLVLRHDFVAVTFGGTSSEGKEAGYWIAAFLCGFSERFAGDIISRLDPKASPVPPEKAQAPDAGG